MTELEAKAKDCIENHTHKLVDKPTKQDIYLREESIFISGYKLGATENGIQWHDLRKDPNDLPKEDCEVFAIVESDGTLYKSVENYFLDKTDTFDGWGTCQKVVAWFDPQFKE